MHNLLAIIAMKFPRHAGGQMARELVSREEWREQLSAFRSSVERYRTAMERTRQMRAALPKRRPSAAHNGATDTTSTSHTPEGESPLSRRELEVAALVARGYKNSDIARELILQIGTVANHVRRIRLNWA